MPKVSSVALNVDWRSESELLHTETIFQQKTDQQQSSMRSSDSVPTGGVKQLSIIIKDDIKIREQ